VPGRDDHDAVTTDQFTRQAEPFASLHTARTDAAILRLIRETACLVTGPDIPPALFDKGYEPAGLQLGPGSGPPLDLDLDAAVARPAQAPRHDARPGPAREAEIVVGHGAASGRESFGSRLFYHLAGPLFCCVPGLGAGE
jgi:hypothetical protein